MPTECGRPTHEIILSTQGSQVMNTSANHANPLAKTLAAALVLSVVGVLILASRQTSSSAALQERVFENKIPAHIPIEIKIKKEKEKSFKDLKNEKWLRELEIEITNTGDKPIYFLYITFVTDVTHDGQRLVFPLPYGRPELGDIVSKAREDMFRSSREKHVYYKWENGRVGKKAYARSDFLKQRNFVLNFSH